MSVLDNIRMHGLKYFTPHRVFVYLRSLLRDLVGYRINQKDAIAFSEVISYKVNSCQDCALKGQCVVCGCPVNELFTAMDVGCSDGKFPAFQETRSWYHIFKALARFKFKEAYSLYKVRHWRDAWEEYKKKNKIFITTIQF